jgi:peptidyl-Lys metalloendopeptidase
VRSLLAEALSYVQPPSVSAAYDFTRSGAGDYSIESSNLFAYVDADGTSKNWYATVEDVAAVKLSGVLAVSRVHGKRATFDSCTLAMESRLNASAASAQHLAANPYHSVSSPSSGPNRYTLWFGAHDASRIGTVQNYFELISSHDFSSFTYDCNCADNDSFSYVRLYIFQLQDCYSVTDRSLDQSPTNSERSGSAGLFWSAPNTGTDSKAGTLVHEASHWSIDGAIPDYVYG